MIASWLLVVQPVAIARRGQSMKRGVVPLSTAINEP
jgi:hypothetical protein